MATAAERETTIVSTDDSDEVRIWTCQPRYVGRLRRHPAYTEVENGRFEGTEWAEFTIPAKNWNPATGAKRASNLTEEQRAASGARLAAMREKKAS